MVNVYVHLEVRGLSATILEDDDFLTELWRQLPDAAVSGDGTIITITLSQYALDRRTAARRQLGRVRRGLEALGATHACVLVGDTVREGVRDDIDCLVHAIRWHLRH